MTQILGQPCEFQVMSGAPPGPGGCSRTCTSAGSARYRSSVAASAICSASASSSLPIPVLPRHSHSVQRPARRGVGGWSCAVGAPEACLPGPAPYRHVAPHPVGRRLLWAWNPRGGRCDGRRQERRGDRHGDSGDRRRDERSNGRGIRISDPTSKMQPPSRSLGSFELKAAVSGHRLFCFNGRLINMWARSFFPRADCNFLAPLKEYYRHSCLFKGARPQGALMQSCLEYRPAT